MDRGSLSPPKLFTILPLGHAIDVGEKDGRLGAFGFGRRKSDRKRPKRPRVSLERKSYKRPSMQTIINLYEK